MNIQQMHTMFRTLGQQMGMQLIRGILPESIDAYINNVIVEKIQQELLGSVRTALQDSVNTQSSTMSAVNVFRTLYRSARYKINININEDGSVDYGTHVDNKSDKIGYYNPENGYHIFNIPTINSNINVESDEYLIDPMMFLGFSIEYDNTIRGNAVACRLIGSDVLETTLRDYCNGASKDAPIVILNAIPSYVDNIEVIGGISNEQLEIYTGCKNCIVKYINVKYIKAPNIVKHDLDINKCVNCDLPAYTHFDIVERAVVKFYNSIGINSNLNDQRPQQYQQYQQRQ